MKLMHLADLHIGKNVNGFSMLEDQAFVLEQILKIAEAEAVSAVLIAGDVYDRPVPSAESVRLLDDFLFRLSEDGRKVYVISGNHDSPERLSFGGRLMSKSGLYIAPPYGGHVEPYKLEDEYGEVCIWLLPFVKPAVVRSFFPEKDIASYTDALRAAVSEFEINNDNRNILVTHQFVTGAARCDSEEISVGGTDNVDVSVFEGFDYVALGHIHGPQNIGSERVRYCGTPLKYSFSEVLHKKSVTVVELGEKDAKPGIRTVLLTPLHGMRVLRGSYEELTRLDFYKDTATDDYIKVILTDEEDIPEGYARLRIIYPNIMKLEYDNTRTRSGGAVLDEAAECFRPPQDLFAEFYESRNGSGMSREQSEFIGKLVGEIWGSLS